MSESRSAADQVSEVAIEALGASGDGIARLGAARLFVPLALPGERWRVRRLRRVEDGWLAEPLERLAGGDRALPPCPHFGRCGGCRLQHLPPAAYAAFKQERIAAALARRGLGHVPVEPVRVAPLGSRRRLRLALTPARGGLRLGFRRRASHAVVPIDVCPIACPELVALLAPLAKGLARALARPTPAEVSLTMTAIGVDLLLHAARAPTLDERQDLAALAAELDLARIAWSTAETAPEPIAMRRQPLVRLAGIEVALPAGAFLQATEFAEHHLAVAITTWAEGATSALDLYAGLGTLSLPLAVTGTRVHAVEAVADAASALRQAAARHSLPVTAEARDLVRRPLTAAELDRFALVLLDPPRAGALPQAQALARSRIPRVLYAACDPASFARDARILVDAGLALVTVRPIDQFLFSPEIELVALFARDTAAKQP